MPESVENRYDPLLLLAIPVFFLWLGANTIWDANEAFYVETPRQMLLSGDYVAPTFNGQPRVNKPILSYWIVAGFYHLFGVSVGVERLAIALGAMLLIASAFLIGRALRSTATGVLAALIVATAPRVVMHSRRIFIDVYITAFTSLAVAGFVLAERHPAAPAAIPAADVRRARRWRGDQGPCLRDPGRRRVRRLARRWSGGSETFDVCICCPGRSSSSRASRPGTCRTPSRTGGRRPGTTCGSSTWARTSNGPLVR